MNIEMTCDGPVTLVIESVKDAKAVKKLEAKKIREARTKNKDSKMIGTGELVAIQNSETD